MTTRLLEHVMQVEADRKTDRKAPVTSKKRSTKPKNTVAKPKLDPDRAEAAAEVLQAVWLHEKHFDLESTIVHENGRAVVDEDAEGHLWVTVRLHVPALDVETWLDRTHGDHPDNQPDEDDEEGA